jgi:VWFA-related protein
MYVRFVAILAVLFAASLDASAKKQSPPSPAQEIPRFRVATDGVRIDAVVTDRDGRVVPGLTADDFEVRQDGKIQKLLFAQFVPVLAGPPTSNGAAVASPETPDQSVHASTSIKREDVQRTLAIVVDDLGLSFESLQPTQAALHAFVDRELRNTDLVALVRTGGSGMSQQSFTTDHRVLHASIEHLEWNGFSRSGVEPFTPLNKWMTFDPRTQIDLSDSKSVDTLHESMSAAGTLGALNLVIRGARDLPGRKALIFVSEGFRIPRPDATPRVRNVLDRVIDQATRAGIVIYSLDCRGLQSGALLAGDNLKSAPLAPDRMAADSRRYAGERTQFNQDTQEGLAYLAEQTGGFAVMNTNNLAGGLGRITEDVRDYYVIGYTPDQGTFAAQGKKPALHKISIRVKRPGLRVKTRKDFIGVSDPAEVVASPTPAQELIHTAISPFVATDIALRATTLPGYSPERGAFVRALLHIDARALKFVDDENGKKAASVDVLGMVFDQDGTEVVHLSTGFAVALTNDAAADALRDGVAYALRIPIRHPGAYQVRFAVRDRESGAVGAAGEFVEMPDIAAGTFSLSGIVLQKDDGSQRARLDDSDQVVLTPAQAVRLYPRGSRLTYAYEIYNATVPVDAVMTIWRGKEKVLSTAPAVLVPPNDASAIGVHRRFAASGGVKLGDALLPGSYILEIAAKLDSADNQQGAFAVRRIDFEVQ